MSLDIYINLTNLPKVLVTPVVSKKRYRPPVYNCDVEEDRLNLITAVKEFYKQKQYRINYVLSSDQIDKIAKKELAGVSLLEFLLDDLISKQNK